MSDDMHVETKFLRLRTPVAIGSRFDDWEVCWLGGWTRHRLSFLVMLVRVIQPSQPGDAVATPLPTL